MIGLLLVALGGVALGGDDPQSELNELRAVLADARAALEVVDAERACHERRRATIASLVDLAEEHHAAMQDPLVSPERRAHSRRTIALAHQRGTLLGGVPVCDKPDDADVDESKRELAAADARPWRDDPLSLRFDARGTRVLRLSRTRETR